MPAVAGPHRWHRAAGRTHSHASGGRDRWCSGVRRRAIRSFFRRSVWGMSVRACGTGRRLRLREVLVCGWPSARAGNPPPLLFAPPRPRLAPGSRTRGGIPWSREMVPWPPAMAAPARMAAMDGCRVGTLSRAPAEGTVAARAAPTRSSAPAARIDHRSRRHVGRVFAEAPRPPIHGSPARSRPQRHGSGFLLTSCHLRIVCAESVEPEMNMELSVHALIVWPRRPAGWSLHGVPVPGLPGESALGPCVEGPTAARTRRSTRHRTGPRRRRRMSPVPVPTAGRR